MDYKAQNLTINDDNLDFPLGKFRINDKINTAWRLSALKNLTTLELTNRPDMPMEKGMIRPHGGYDVWNGTQWIHCKSVQDIDKILEEIN